MLCALPRCKCPGEIIYINKPVCWGHWCRYTDEDWEDGLKVLRRKLKLPPHPPPERLVHAKKYRIKRPANK